MGWQDGLCVPEGFEAPTYDLTATYSPDDHKLRLSSATRLDRDVYDRLKAAGFAWAPKQDQFIASRRAGALIYNFGQAACVGGAARGAARARAGSPGSKARRLRGELRASPPAAAELGQAAHARLSYDIT